MNNNSKLTKISIILLLIFSFGAIAYQLGAMNPGSLPDSPAQTVNDQVQSPVDTPAEDSGSPQAQDPGHSDDSEVICTLEYDPVCGKIEGHAQNFGNLCEAEKAGALDIEPGKCAVNPAPNDGVVLCPEMPGPVCAVLEGEEKNFDNACVAQQAGATDITPGKCTLILKGDLSQACPQANAPVCGILNGKKVNYKNDCEAKKAGATDLKTGMCTMDIKL